MKRIILLFVSLLICLTGCAPGTTGTQQSSSPAESRAAKSSAPAKKQVGTVTVEITPPAGWTRVEGSVLPVQYMKGTASFMVKPEPFESSTLDEVVMEATAIYRKSFSDYAVEKEVQPVTVDGKDARELACTCTVSNIRMKFLYVFLFAGDQTYVITFGDQESTFDALDTDIKTILSEIRFVVN